MHYFGTDGIRNTAKHLLDNNIPYLLGKALSQKSGRILIARDVRTHSSDIEKQLCSGLLEGDAQIWLTGVLPTPALAYTAKVQSADYAVMITASHNPPEFNGLKIFGKNGKKLSLDEEVALDNALFDLKNSNIDCLHTNLKDNNDIFCQAAADCLTEDEEDCELSISLSPKNHRIRIVEGAEFLYTKHVRNMFPRFDGIKVHLDCAYGCFAELAANVFLSLGATVCTENNVRDGNRVNVNCGSTHIKSFASKVKHDEIGFAFDGDGDRVLAVVDKKVYDGDAILLALSTLYRIQGKLRKKFVVGTELTNSRLQRELAFQNTALVRTPVGDKYVLDTLLAQNCLLGGEKSGHILMLDRANTGDGLITALTLLEVKKTIGSLPNFYPYPMLEFNIPAPTPKEYIKDAAFERKIKVANSLYGKIGRFVIRPSGTEPYVRISYECFAQNYQSVFEEVKNLFCN